MNAEIQESRFGQPIELDDVEASNRARRRRELREDKKLAKRYLKKLRWTRPGDAAQLAAQTGIKI